MRLKSLTLRNCRLFGPEGIAIRFSDTKNITIILGGNGTGKSTILDAISNQLSVWVSQFHGYTLQQYKDTDIHILQNEKIADYLWVESLFSTSYNGELNIVRTRKGWGGTKTPQSTFGQTKQYAELLLEKEDKGEDYTLPLVAYYGTGRGQIQAPERKRNFQKVFSRWDCYDGALNAATNFKRFFAWFDQMEDEERRAQGERRDFDYQLPELSIVRDALQNFIGEKYSKPRIEIRPLRFVVDEHAAEGKRELRIEQLSDGYKIITAMVADIASRLAEANPKSKNPLNASGIVLIDEIDLHLHPKWQRRIIADLSKTFPNIQFIVTSHSPILLQGAIDNAQIIVLNGTKASEIPSEELDTYDISQILISELFNLESSRAPKWDKQIEEQEALLAKPTLSAEEKEKLEQLSKELSALSFGSTLDSIKTRELLYKIANSLGIN